MSSIFGGSKSKGTQSSTNSSTSSQSAESGNKSFDFIRDAFGSSAEGTGNSLGAIGALLSGDTAGFDAYRKATGFDAAAEAGSRGITGNAAAGGMLRSGSTGKALSQFGNDLTQQSSNNYLDKLLGLANSGMQAGSLISGAGQYSKSQGQSQSTGNSYGSNSSSSKPGLGGFLGAVGSGIAASDRRLKKNIHKVGELDNGLNIYQYRYINNEGPYIGVMADEVEKLIPEALGPVINGYMTVDYGKIGK